MILTLALLVLASIAVQGEGGCACPPAEKLAAKVVPLTNLLKIAANYVQFPANYEEDFEKFENNFIMSNLNICLILILGLLGEGVALLRLAAER